MYSSVLAVVEGIAAQSNVNKDSQLTTALFVLSLLPSMLKLQKAWLDTIKDDAEKYYADSLSAATGNEKAVALAAADNQTKLLHSQQSALETGKQNTLVEQQKAQLQIAGNNTSLTFGLMTSVSDYISSITNKIMRVIP